MPWFLYSLVLSVAHRSGKEISALDNTFALIDEYIDADLPSFETFSCIHTADHTFGKFDPVVSHNAVSRDEPKPRHHRLRISREMAASHSGRMPFQGRDSLLFVWIEIQRCAKGHAVFFQRHLQFLCLRTEDLVQHP